MEQTISQTYVAEVYEAIRLLTDNYTIYSNVLQETKETSTKGQEQEKAKVPKETTAILREAVGNLRRFEKHAWIRLNAISEPQKINLDRIKELRGTLKSMVPSEAETEVLVIEYHKILSTKITEDAFSTQTGKIDDLTGK